MNINNNISLPRQLDLNLTPYADLEVLNEEEIKNIGKLLWQNRSLFSEKEIEPLEQEDFDALNRVKSIITNIGKILWQNLFSEKPSEPIEQEDFDALYKVKSMVHGQLKPKIRSSATDDKIKNFVLTLVERLMPIDLPMEMLHSIVVNHSNPTDAKTIIREIVTDPENSGIMLAETMYKNRLSMDYIEDMPISLKHLKYVDFSKEKNLTVDMLRMFIDSEIEELILPDNFNAPIPEELLSKLKVLKMGRDYNQPFSEGLDLSNLVTLKMGHRYNQPLPEGLNLGNLQTLEMGDWYNQLLPESLNLGNLQTLTIGFYYNQLLPERLNLGNLLTLTMGYLYNQPLLEGLNLSSLETLTMGILYNQPLPKGLNLSNLVTLTMGWEYNQPLLEGLNLGNLLTLVISVNYTQMLPQILRDNEDLLIIRQLIIR